VDDWISGRFHLLTDHATQILVRWWN